MAKLHIQKELDPRRKIGVGDANPDAIVAAISEATKAAPYALPTVAKVQWEFAGPIAPGDVQKTLGDTIDILGSGQNPQGVDEVYQTPGLNDGEFQTWVLACAFGIHLEYSSECFSVRGNAFTRPTNPAASPYSPDIFTLNDITGTIEGASNTVPVGTLPADLDYGTPAGRAFWAMVRAYNLRWTYGSQINIMDEQLRETAYMPPNPQEGSASSSEVWVGNAVREVNNRYVNTLGSLQDFRMIDALRVGALNSATGQSVFTPSRDFEYAGVTYGGPDLRAKIGIGSNSEFRSLSNPRLLKPGVKIGLLMEARNTELQRYFQNQFDSTAGYGGNVPPAFTNSPDYTTAFGTAFPERTIDGATVTQQVPGLRAYFKGFRALMSTEIRGWEPSDQLADMIVRNSSLAARLCSECGCMAGWPT